MTDECAACGAASGEIEDARGDLVCEDCAATLGLLDTRREAPVSEAGESWIHDPIVGWVCLGV